MRTERNRKSEDAGIDVYFHPGAALRRREARASRARTPAIASSIPAMEPHNDSKVLSVSSWRMTRPRLAPSALRTAISRCLVVPLINSRLATFAHAMSNTKATVPMKINNDLRIFADEQLIQRENFRNHAFAGGPGYGRQDASRRPPIQTGPAGGKPWAAAALRLGGCRCCWGRRPRPGAATLQLHGETLKPAGMTPTTLY